MKKLLALALASILLFSTFSLISCNRKENNESGVSNYAETTTYDVKDSTGKVLGTLSYKAKGTDYAVVTGYQPRISGPHSVVIPEVFPGSERTVVEIGDEAFRACTSVTSIKLPETVEKIGDWAFYLCSSIYYMNIPANVASIGKGAFVGCNSLTIVKFAGEKPLLTEVGAYAFNACPYIESIALPEGVETIGEGAFFECGSLKTVTLPESVTSIGATAFAKCDALESIKLGGNISELGEYAFGTLITDNSEVLVYTEGTTTANTIQKVLNGEPETDGE